MNDPINIKRINFLIGVVDFKVIFPNYLNVDFHFVGIVVVHFGVELIVAVIVVEVVLIILPNQKMDHGN